MVLLVVFLICIFVTLAIGGLAGLSDFRSLTIPNTYSLYVIASFVVAYGALSLGGLADVVFSSVWSHLISAGVTFVITAILFTMKVIGAGDSKFGTACALWVGAKYMPIYLFFMTLIGGLLGAYALYVKKKKPFEAPVEGGWIDQVQKGHDKVPYGIAIAIGMLIAFLYAGYFSPAVLSLFVGGTIY